MAETGKPGGRQALENNRVQAHVPPPEVGNAASVSLAANAKTIAGGPNTNVTRSA